MGLREDSREFLALSLREKRLSEVRIQICVDVGIKRLLGCSSYFEKVKEEIRWELVHCMVGQVLVFGV